MDWIDGDFRNELKDHPQEYGVAWETLCKKTPDSKSGLKHDDGKPMYDLIDPYFTEGLAKVLTFGAGKYNKHNWRNGIQYSRLLASLERHLAEIKKNHDVDPESGLPHIFHAACNAMFLSYFMSKRPDLDDRWKEQNDKPIS